MEPCDFFPLLPMMAPAISSLALCIKCRGLPQLTANSPRHISHLSSYKKDISLFQEPTTMATKTASFKVGSEVFKTSYTVFGDLKSGTRPVVVLNGGPGISHWYMLPHAELYQKRGVDVSSCSTTSSAVATRRVCATSPLTSSRRASSSPSWTTSCDTSASRTISICSDHPRVSRSRPSISRCTTPRDSNTSCSLASQPRTSSGGRRAQWPKDFQDMLDRDEMDGTTDAPEYQEGLVQFYRKHILNLEVWRSSR